MKKLKNVLIIAGIMTSLSFVNCYAMEKNNDFNKNNNYVITQGEKNKKLRYDDSELKISNIDNFVLVRSYEKGSKLKETKPEEDEEMNRELETIHEEIEYFNRIVRESEETNPRNFQVVEQIPFQYNEEDQYYTKIAKKFEETLNKFYFNKNKDKDKDK